MLMSGYKEAEGDGNPDDWNIDNTQFVYDYADVFTSSEELELQEMCEKTGKELGLDLVIVAAKDLGGMHEMNYEKEGLHFPYLLQCDSFDPEQINTAAVRSYFYKLAKRDGG